MAQDKDAAGIQTIARAAAVLRALERESEGMSLAELGAALDTFEQDDAIGCIVLTGSNKAFAA
ncbi:MAG: enoyl-CoA hydratase, partial [Pseudomonadota bacterium]